MESPYATFYVSVIVTYLLSYSVSEIWQIIGPVLVVDRDCLSSVHLLGSAPNFNFKTAQFGLKKQKHPSIVLYEVYFDILNFLGMHGSV